MTDVDAPLEPAAAARLREAILLTADGGFDAALALIAAPSSGPLAGLEQAVRSLIADYRGLVAHHTFSIDEFAASKRELLTRLDTIRAQQAAIRTLSAPILEIWDGVVAVPLIGELDAAGPQELAARLLARLARSRVAWVILDLTGVAEIDAALAGHLVQLASAVRLMGARGLVTGIGPGVARTLVGLDVSLAGLVALASLRDGLKHCIAGGA
ncbi:MAG: STAS domain-containing protein [Myxococcales bacterium]|nr:STAS domain-containing protein [Myxococcales bacterium]